MFLPAKIAKNQGPTEQWLSPKNLMIRANSDFVDSDTKMFPPRKQSQLIELIFSCADATFIVIFLFFTFSHNPLD